MGRSGLVVMGALLALSLVSGWALVFLAIARNRLRAGGSTHKRRVRARGLRRRKAPTVLGRREAPTVPGDRAPLQPGVRPLTLAVRDAFAAEWQALQAGFADRPDTAVRDADALIGRLMQVRGYRVGVECGAEPTRDLPGVVEDFRMANAIALQRSSRLASTDELRRVLLRYRSLLDELLVVIGPDGTLRAAPLSEEGWGGAPISVADMPPLGGEPRGPRVS